MSEHASVCQFSEGLVTLPEGYQDRTVNAFVAPAAGAPSFNITRDVLKPDETLAAYIDRQIALMEKHLKGWKQIERIAVMLGENLLQGERVHASYLREGKRISQQQAVFITGDAHILVFTMSSAVNLTDADNRLFEDLLRSFRGHA
ncbi:DUF1795 domain-containing protein [Kosakonia sacchari]|uniref:DUF1795 domain-containing protein n=1 Tax=Kosakonia sacchari TaxID=1158459 RepID=UPI0032D8F649